MISLQNVHKKFDGRGIAGVRGVSLALHPGEVLAVMGPNGSGKTTLINLISGVHQPDSGAVQVDGNVRLFKGIEEAEDMNVQRYLIKQNSQSIDDDKKLQLARDFADIFEFTFQLRQNLSQLSAGQRQKVGLAAELVNRPALLLLDEPFTHLDPHTRKDILRSLFTYIRQQETSILWVTHDLDEAMRFSDRVGVLNFGVFEQLDHPSALLEAPRNLFVAQFLGFENFLPEGDKELLVVPDDAWTVDPNGLKGEVLEHSFKGTRRTCRVRLSDRDIVMSFSRSGPLPPVGARLGLNPDRSKCFTIPL